MPDDLLPTVDLDDTIVVLVGNEDVPVGEELGAVGIVQLVWAVGSKGRREPRMNPRLFVDPVRRVACPLESLLPSSRFPFIKRDQGPDDHRTRDVEGGAWSATARSGSTLPRASGSQQWTPPVL